MSHCPSCGRYVGPYDACPTCGTRMPARLPIRVVKLAAVLLSTLGLAVLWFVARRAEIPTIPVGRASATMNLAYVRVEGRCTRIPSYDPETGYLGFWLSDETGELYVTSYREETRSLLEEGRVPALGDRVSVAGTLRIREDFRALTLNAPAHLLVTRDEPETSSLAAVLHTPPYDRVRVRGQIRQVVEPYSGLTLVTLRDQTGTVDVALSDDLVALSGITPSLAIGQSVEVVAAVSQYEGTPQLVPASIRDIVALDDAVPLGADRFVVELSSQDVGHWVRVRGAVADVEPFSAGVKLTLDDGSGPLTVLLWDDVRAELEQELVSGSELYAQGELVEYRGELEVVPELPSDVAILAPPPDSPPTDTPQPIPSPLPTTALLSETTVAPSSTPTTPTPTPEPTSTPTSLPTPTPRPTLSPAVALTPIASITMEHVDQDVNVQGRVISAASFSHGFKLTLEDGTGQIVLLMWHDVYDDCWDASGINVGARVRAKGIVSQYEGQLQVEPRSGSGVKAIQPATALPPPRAIGSLSGADESRRVTIEGQVARVEGLDSAVKISLRETAAGNEGEIVVFIWRNVLDRIADNAGLGTPGSRVRVVGRVQVYRSNLEVVPALPNDVTVLDVP